MSVRALIAIGDVICLAIILPDNTANNINVCAERLATAISTEQLSAIVSEINLHRPGSGRGKGKVIMNIYIEEEEDRCDRCLSMILRHDACTRTSNGLKICARCYADKSCLHCPIHTYIAEGSEPAPGMRFKCKLDDSPFSTLSAGEKAEKCESECVSGRSFP